MDDKTMALAEFLEVKPVLISNDYSEYFAVNERKELEGYSREHFLKTVEDFRSILPKKYLSEIAKGMVSTTPLDRQIAYNIVSKYLTGLKPKAERRAKQVENWSFKPKETKLDVYNRLNKEHLYIENILYHLLQGDSKYSTNLRKAWICAPVDDMRELTTRNDGEYLVLTDKEADEWEEDGLRSLFDDMTGGLEGWVKEYIDVDKFIEENGGNRGANISTYDGVEHEQEYDGTTYFIYRTN